MVKLYLKLADPIAIPSALKRALLQQFHSRHPGISRMKFITRMFVCSPRIDQGIDAIAQRYLKFQQAPKPCYIRNLFPSLKLGFCLTCQWSLILCCDRFALSVAQSYSLKVHHNYHVH